MQGGGGADEENDDNNPSVVKNPIFDRNSTTYSKIPQIPVSEVYKMHDQYSDEEFEISPRGRSSSGMSHVYKGSSTRGRGNTYGTEFSENTEEKVKAVSPKAKHWATTHMLHHDVVLNDIEKKDPPEKPGGRSRGASVIATEFQAAQPRARRYSTESIEGIQEYLRSSSSQYRKIFDLLDATIPNIQSRLNVYSTLFFLLCLCYMSQNLTHPRSWFGLFFSLIGLDIATSIIDHAFFVYFIDKIFANHFNIAYLLHSFNGPIGLLITAFFAKSSFPEFDAVKTIASWDRIVNAAVIVLLFVCIKNWYTRKHYIALLERRFADKLFQMETWNIILSELSSRKPPKTIKRQLISPQVRKNHTNSVTSVSGGGGGEGSSVKNDSNSVTPKPARTDSNIKDYIENIENDLTINGIGTFFSAVPGLQKFHKKVINVFADLVEATSKYNDEYEEDVDVASQIRRNISKSGKSRGKDPENNSSVPSPPRDDDDDSPLLGETITRSTTMTSTTNQTNDRIRMEIRKRKTFWELAARISTNMGTLKIRTYNGPVVIRRKFQAKEFGQSLYLHLSRGNKYIINHELFAALFKNLNPNVKNELPPRPSNRTTTASSIHNNNYPTDYDRLNDLESQSQKYNPNSATSRYSAITILSGKEDKDAATLLYETALELFDPFNLGYVTEEQCMAAVCLVYKEYRYAATSLNDYGELHKSLRNVMDFVFWMMMLVILQTYLSFNVYSEYILPFVTMAFTISFALGPSLGQVLVATVFVFFMVPYEIGHKVVIGVDPTIKITGYVRGITLLQTTITTVKNETMKVPNHILFGEKISNLAESGGAYFEFTVNFTINPTDPSFQDRIDQYLERVKAFALYENRTEWESCVSFCTSVTLESNQAVYSLYLVHRDSYQDMTKAMQAKQELLLFMRETYNSMGFINPPK